MTSEPLPFPDPNSEAMAEQSSSESLPGHLADTLAELVTQLRLSVTLPDESSSPPASLPRLVVLARLLCGQVDQAAGLANLGTAITSLAELLTEYPAEGVSLSPSLLRLTEFLESFLLGLDQGDDMDTWLNNPRWVSLQRSFGNAGTPLAVFDDLDDLIHQYSRQNNHLLFPPVGAEAMARRWAEICRQGDQVFGASYSESLVGVRVILLLDSEMSQHFLAEKLVQGGAEVVIADNPAQAWKFVGLSQTRTTILCDQVSPSNHLTSFKNLAGQKPLNIVMVSIGDSSGYSSNLERARKLGAQGVWRDPFEMADVVPCILQGNRDI